MKWRDLREELEEHVRERTWELIEAGVPEQEARKRARREFGNTTLLTESSRDVWVWTWLDRLGQDLRYAVRTMRRRPAFTIAAIVSLALGVGANTAVFGLLDALLLETVAVKDPRELVQVIEGEREAFPYPIYDRLRGSAQLKSVIAVWPSLAPARIVERGEGAQAFVDMVSGNFFDSLGIMPQRGRTFQESETELAAVISDLYWQRRFGRDPSILGARFRYYSRDFTVVGIAPPEFRGLVREFPTDIWVPMEPSLAPNDMMRTRIRVWRIMGRVPPGGKAAAAQAEIRSRAEIELSLRPGATGYSALRTRLTRPLLLLELVVGLVLLIACANLANLLMASGLAREREISARWALGASRGRIMRQLLTENALLTALGGAFGLGLAYWISGALIRFLPPEQASALANLEFSVDARALAFAFLLSVVTCLLFGLAPALRATRSAAIARTGAGVQRNRTLASRSLLVSEVAMSTLLLIVAGMFAGSARNLRGQDTGYRENGLIVADVEPPRQLADEARDMLLEELRARVSGLPGVEGAAYSNAGQLSGFGIDFYIQVEGRQQREPTPVMEQLITDGFLSVVGARLIAGREFTTADRVDTPLVALVNESFARRYLAPGSPIGKRFTRTTGTHGGEPMEVVGVVQDSKWINLREESPAMYYRPYSQMGGTPVVRFAIRVSGNAEAVAAGLAQIAASIDRGTVVRNVVPFEEIVNRSLVVERLTAYVSSAAAGVALLIAAIGLHGLLVYQVLRRRREIGVRVALGATSKAVEWMVVRESLVLVAAGFAIGVPAAVSVMRAVSSMLFGLSPQDPATIATIFGVLAISTAAAAYAPARRASRVDPMRALREE